MDGVGEILRQRAQELGLTDSEVARRVGISQSRYANYVKDAREPDYTTLVRICRVLGTTPNAVLGFAASIPLEDEAERSRQRIAAAVAVMQPDTLRRAAALMEALLAED